MVDKLDELIIVTLVAVAVNTVILSPSGSGSGGALVAVRLIELSIVSDSVVKTLDKTDWFSGVIVWLSCVDEIFFDSADVSASMEVLACVVSSIIVDVCIVVTCICSTVFKGTVDISTRFVDSVIVLAGFNETVEVSANVMGAVAVPASLVEIPLVLALLVSPILLFSWFIEIIVASKFSLCTLMYTTADHTTRAYTRPTLYLVISRPHVYPNNASMLDKLKQNIMIIIIV